MTAADPSAILARAGVWAAELRQRGQLDQVTAERLNETLNESFGERLDHQDDPLLVVMLCGPTAVGKSSLINALAGAEISPPGLGATTRAAVLYVHQQDDPTRLFEFTHALGDEQQETTELVRHQRDELLHKVLVDSPDIDSIRLRHRALTARLVHAADLVLFVTSPEKYKVMRSARWLLEQRRQRALAFVLNKWDRQALGLQHDRRDAVAEDFRSVLAGEGFPDALVFKVSALPVPALEQSADQARDDIENELPALRTWLQTGLTQSTASVIRRRRLRAAWGRLAATIERASPRPLSTHPLLPEIVERLAARAGVAEHGIVAEASVQAADGVEDNGWPSTPGLLGMWVRTWHRTASTAASLRTGLAAFGVAARSGPPDSGSRPRIGSAHGFGARSVAILADTAAEITSDAAAAGMVLGPVGAAWAGEVAQLEPLLATVPLDVAADLTARASRRTLRRMIGLTWVYAVEGLIILVLLVALVRAGTDFVNGTYAPGALFGTVAMLLAMLVIVGHTGAAMFFPPLRTRLRRTIAQRAASLVKHAAQRMRTALQDQVAAVDRLARDGRSLLDQIDDLLEALITDDADGAGVDRLFGEPRQKLIAQATPLPGEPIQDDRIRESRRPRFD